MLQRIPCEALHWPPHSGVGAMLSRTSTREYGLMRNLDVDASSEMSFKQEGVLRKSANGSWT